jgi:hypothetical protein
MVAAILHLPCDAVNTLHAPYPAVPLVVELLGELAEVGLSWLEIHARNRAGVTTWIVERISPWPMPHSRLHTTG